jgi:hypothetical protein
MPSPPAITFRTNDFVLWGAGNGVNLTARQVDLNFWNLLQAVTDLQALSGSNSIVAVTASGNTISFLTSNGTTLGPITIPTAAFSWRGAWAPNTVYNALDVVSVTGVGTGIDGLYLVLRNHTSAGSFNPAATDAAGNALYLQMFAYPLQPFSVSLSLGSTFVNAALNPWDGNYELCNTMMPVPVTFPAGLATSPTPICLVAPVANVTFTLQKIHAGSATTLGTLTIPASATTGTYSFASPVTIPAGDCMRAYAPPTVDTTIAGISAVIVGTR